MNPGEQRGESWELWSWGQESGRARQWDWTELKKWSLTGYVLHIHIWPMVISWMTTPLDNNQYASGVAQPADDTSHYCWVSRITTWAEQGDGNNNIEIGTWKICSRTGERFTFYSSFCEWLTFLITFRMEKFVKLLMVWFEGIERWKVDIVWCIWCKMYVFVLTYNKYSFTLSKRQLNSNLAEAVVKLS